MINIVRYTTHMAQRRQSLNRDTATDITPTPTLTLDTTLSRADYIKVLRATTF